MDLPEFRQVFKPHDRGRKERGSKRIVTKVEPRKVPEVRLECAGQLGSDGIPLELEAVEPKAADPTGWAGKRNEELLDHGDVDGLARDCDDSKQARGHQADDVFGELAAVLKVYLFVCPDSPCRSIDLMPLRQAQGTKQM